MRELTPNTLTDAIFAAVADHSRPLLTYYDDATGERTELSAITAANWAAKTANLVRDEFGLMPGDVVAVDLPTDEAAECHELIDQLARVFIEDMRLGRPVPLPPYRGEDLVG